MTISDTLTEDEREDLRRAAAFGGRAEAVIGTIERLLSLAMTLRGDTDPAFRERGNKIKAKALGLIDLMLDCDLGREDDHE